jgi:hypothetical protein
MVTFEIALNGNRICTAGITTPGVLSTILTWATPNREQPELRLHVGGLENHDHVRWTDLGLAVGDVLEIRVVEQSRRDEPAERQAEDPDLVGKEERRYYEALKAKYGD